jgi:hypothetical protein
MKNKTLLFLTSLVLLAIASLFLLNLHFAIQGSPIGETYLKYNDVRGMAVDVNEKLYTLNFEQQKEAIGIINRSVRLQHGWHDKRENLPIRAIMVYQFDQQPDVQMIPVGFQGNRLVFYVPQWDKNNDFMELTGGEFLRLLNQTYDHSS